MITAPTIHRMTARIMIADDDSAVRQLLTIILEEEGYEVTEATNGDELVRMAQQSPPHVIIVDLMMPVLDGYEAIRQLRNDTRTSHLPMLILTARNTPNDVVIGFETGADDVIAKPFDTRELLARVRHQLRVAARLPVRSPLTGLNGNVLLTEEIKYRLQQEKPFAYMYADMDSFKAFNDTYGVARGDRLIKKVAKMMVDAVNNYGTGQDFLGHIGGDDFAIITTPEQVDTLSNAILSGFDEQVRELYDQEDLERGYLIGHDRQGVMRRFPIVSLSIGVVTNMARTFEDHEEVSRIAAEMKQFAKQQPHSSYAVDDRVAPAVQVEQDRRGQALSVLCVGTSSVLVQQWCDALANQHYRVLAARDIIEAHALLAHSFNVSVILIEALIGDAMDELIASLEEHTPPIKIVVAYPHTDGIAPHPQADAVLMAPFTTGDLLATVAHVTQSGA